MCIRDRCVCFLWRIFDCFVFCFSLPLQLPLALFSVSQELGVGLDCCSSITFFLFLVSFRFLLCLLACLRVIFLFVCFFCLSRAGGDEGGRRLQRRVGLVRRGGVHHAQAEEGQHLLGERTQDSQGARPGEQTIAISLSSFVALIYFIYLVYFYATCLCFFVFPFSLSQVYRGSWRMHTFCGMALHYCCLPGTT